MDHPVEPAPPRVGRVTFGNPMAPSPMPAGFPLGQGAQVGGEWPKVDPDPSWVVAEMARQMGRLMQETAALEKRVAELLEANNAEVERRRAAEARVAEMEAKHRDMFAATAERLGAVAEASGDALARSAFAKAVDGQTETLVAALRELRAEVASLRRRGGP